MKNFILLSLVSVLGLAVLAGAQLVVPSPTPARVGKVLVLDNEHTLEGDIELVGDQYRVRRTIGATFVPTNRVLALCASMVDAYRFLQGRCNLRDADERLRLAEWCRVHGLRDQAIDEVRAAVALRPEHVPSQRMLQNLTVTPSLRPGGPGGATDPEPGPLPALDLNAEAMTQFTTRVQPILMNACANCHASGRGGSFKLLRTYEAVLVPQRTTVTNAAAVLAQINVEQPLQSNLLSKALNLHGEMTAAPFKNRQAPAFRTLEEWVRVAAASQPPREPAPVVPMSATPTAPPSFAVERGSEPKTLPPIEPARTVPTTPVTAPPMKTLDPFDPDVFNRQNQPQPPPAPRP